MHYTCHRCGHDVARTARDCAACGKPIAPLPWHRKIRAPGRRAPDAHVLDYERSTLVPRTFLVILVFCAAILGGLKGLSRTEVDTSVDSHARGWVSDYLSTQDPPAQDPPARARLGARLGVEILIAERDSMARTGTILSWLIICIGVFGMAVEAGRFPLTRRLVAMIEDLQANLDTA